MDLELSLSIFGCFEAGGFEQSFEDRVKSSSADILCRLVDLVGKVGDGFDAVLGELQFDTICGEECLVLSSEATGGFGEDPDKVISSEVIEFDSNREPSLQFGHHVAGS